MRLMKIASQKSKKNNQLKYDLQQQQTNECPTPTNCQTEGLGKHFGGGASSVFSDSNNSGSACSIVAGANSGAQRSSFGNGSCISSFDSTQNKCANKRRKSSKASKCFSSTVFRCCLPCRGGSGSAAPATSSPLTPVLPINSNSAAVDSAVRRKYSGKSAIELTTDGNESLIAAVKKHSLAETIGTSATTPISLKTLINDEDEDLQPHISAAEIAAAKLATGILPRKAEPETLSDTSVSPTTAVLQFAANSASANSLLSTTNSLQPATVANTQVTFAANKTTIAHISHTTPPNTNSNFICQANKFEQNCFVPTTINTTTTTSSTKPPLSLLPATTTVVSPTSAIATAIASSATTTTSPSTTSSTPSRCCCPPPQTSPLPHIKEEEESEQLLQRQHSANHDDETLTEPTSERHIAHQQQQQQQQQQSQLDQLYPFTANQSGSSDSCTSLSNTTATTAPTSSITASGCTPLEFIATSTPSPRNKHKFRKQHKSGWSRIIVAPNSSIVPIGSSTCCAANSSETLASSSNNSSSAAAAAAPPSVSATLASVQTRLASTSATALTTQQSSSSQLLPVSKMQAEQGSIGDLQKYHSRYLKNRRHTLANVR